MSLCEATRSPDKPSPVTLDNPKFEVKLSARASQLKSIHAILPQFQSNTRITELIKTIMPSPSQGDLEKPGRKRRPTIEDLALAADVSVATVDRVLNKRHPVREDTARRVVEAAERIGFYARGLLRQRLDERIPFRTLSFLLQKRNDYFYQQLGAELIAATRAASAVRGRPVVEFMDELIPSMIAERLRQAGGSADAVAVVAVEHPHVNAAIEELQQRGVPVFTLLTDVTTPARAGYLGLDGRKTGRTAAWTISLAGARAGQDRHFGGQPSLSRPGVGRNQLPHLSARARPPIPAIGAVGKPR